MAILDELREVLDGERVEYTVRAHREAFTAKGVAATEHLPESEMAKVVVVRAGDAYWMIVLPASRRIDLQELRDVLDEPGLHLATEEEIACLFPSCEPGAMPPFGRLWSLPVYVDDTLSRHDRIAFNAGNHHETVHMAYADFERIVKPRHASFARPDWE
jgi:Ala-tRNA(Pro) deacylase